MDEVMRKMKTPVIHRNHQTPWTALAPGIEMQIFFANEETGVWTVKIYMHAGSTLPPHKHVGAAEFYIIEGKGTHKEAGEFAPGTYAYEPANAVHSPVHAEDVIILYMTSYGPSTFNKTSGEKLYDSDAAYFKQQMEMSRFRRAVKRFFFITVWSVFKGKK